MQKFKLSKTSIYIILISIIILFCAIFYIKQKYSVNNIEMVVSQNPPIVKDNPPTNTQTPQQPKDFLLKVPFTPQAPTANWDELHNEACEEASAIMANAYLTGDTETVMPADKVEQQISALTNWQQQNFGYYLDITSAETATMVESYYHLHTKQISNFSSDDIRNALLAHNIVLISENGRMLGNPNYKQPGPIHHMLVIRGYTEEGFVTNDSGTRRGQNYFYTFDTLKNAAADWNHSTNNVDGTKKIAIIVSK